MVPRVDDIDQVKAQMAMRLALIKQDLASFGGREYSEMQALRSPQSELYDWYS
jgi:hypothetical protein